MLSSLNGCQVDTSPTDSKLSEGDISYSRAWNQKMEKEIQYLAVIDWKRVLGLLHLPCNSLYS